MRNISDVHVHISEHNVEKAKSALDVIGYIGITRAALQSLTYRSVAYNLWLLYLKKIYTDIELSVFGMIDCYDLYKPVPFEVQAKALVEMGCDGIKLMCAPGSRKRIGFGLNNERYDKMFDYLEENGIPVLIHVNDPEEFWDEASVTPYRLERGWCYFQEGYLKKEEIYAEVFEMLDKHPNLKVTFAHFFFLSNFMDEAERVLAKYPNVTYDLAPGWEMFVGFSKDPEGWHDFFVRHADRIIYGTDTNNTKRSNAEIHMLVRMGLERSGKPFMMPYYSEQLMHGLGLDEESLEKIYNGNYTRIVGKPREIDTSAIVNAAERILSDTEGMDGDSIAAGRECLKMIVSELK